MKCVLILVLLLFASPVWAVTITDDFNCADSATLGCDLTWVEAVGTEWSTEGNVAEFDASTGEAIAYTSAMTNANYYVQAKITTLTDPGASNIHVTGVLCRKTADAAMTFYAWVARRGDSGINDHRLEKQVAGSYTLIATDTTDYSAGEVLKLECDGSKLRAYINGTPASFGEQTDTDISAAGRPGIFAFDNTGTFEDIYLDDFEASDIVASTRKPQAPVVFQ